MTPRETETTTREASGASGSGSLAAATTTMNVTTYGFTMVAAHVVGPGQYGAFVASLNLLIVIQVVALGIQAAAARRIAADPGHVVAVERSVMRLTVRTSFAVGAALVLLAPVVDRVLNLDSLPTALVIALASVPLTMAGGQAGILQGERRWRELSLMYFMGGIPRLTIGAALILWRPEATMAVVGVGVGYLFPIMVGAWALRRRERMPAVDEATQHTPRAILGESLHNAQALCAYFALSSADIIVARNVLPELDAGLYAAGLIMAKVMLFLPQFVVLLAFPDMATVEGRHRALLKNLAVVLAIGVVVTGSVAVLDEVALFFVGGADFAGVQEMLWTFAVLGTVLSMLQLQVYAVLARQGRRSILLVWVALVALVGLGLAVSTLDGLVWVVIGVDSALMLALLAISIHQHRRTAAHGHGTRRSEHALGAEKGSGLEVT